MDSTLSKSKFVAQFGGIYEHSTWIAETCFDASAHLSIAHAKDLAEPMAKIVEAATEQQKLDLLRAHPDLAGKLAKTGALTEESTSEQASAGLDGCTDAEFAEFTSLNTTYCQRFGFPYILAVKGRHRVEILENFRARVNNPPDVEFREALDQVHQIAKLRLSALDD